MDTKEPNTPSDHSALVRPVIPPEGELSFATALHARGIALPDGKPFETGVYLELSYWTAAGTVRRSSVVMSPDQAAALVAEVESAAKVALYLAGE